MDTSTLFTVEPTFPIADTRIRARSREAMLHSPLTWGILAAAVVLGLLMDAGVTGFIILFACAFFAVGKYWQKQAPKLDAASLRDLIEESNAAQDAELMRIIAHLHYKGQSQYGLCLRRLLNLKQAIERDIHRAQHLAAFAPEVEKGVDGICAEVCREITRIREGEAQLGEVLTSCDPVRLDRLEGTRRESHAAILHAYASLGEVHAEILGIGSGLCPQPRAEDAAGLPGQRLQQILGGLRDEADMISRTRARVQETIASCPPSVEAT